MSSVKCRITGKQLSRIVSIAKAIQPDPLALRFCPDGIRLSMSDLGQVCMMTYHLPLEKLEDYQLEPPEGDGEVEIQLSLTRLEEAVKVVCKDQVLLTYDTSTGSAKLTFKAGRITRSIPTLVQEKEYRRDLPKSELSSGFTMPGNVLEGDLQSVKSVADFFLLGIQEGAPQLAASNYEDTIDVRYTKEESDPVGAASCLYTASYILDMLTGLVGSEPVKVEFDTNRPIRVSYSNDTGNYIGMCAPRIVAE